MKNENDTAIDKAIKGCRRDSLSRVVTENPRAVKDS